MRTLSIGEKYEILHHLFSGCVLGAVPRHTKACRLRANCALYLHGHSCGGTNPSLIEAMYLGLPIATFDVNFNRETTMNQALYFQTAAQLEELCARIKPEKLRKIGSDMRNIALERYSWKRISALYSALFE